jgi:CubicO group peptidase (beta-lactamase class C family)
VGSPTQKDLIPNYAKALPFDQFDPVTLNEAYWRHIDFILKAAGDRGLTIALATMWGRDADSLFPNALKNNERYGTLLGRRYRNRDNLVWLVTGEYEKIEDNWRQDHDISDEQRTLLRAIAHGLEAGHEGRHLMTIHPIYTSSRDFHDDPWLNFNMQQTWGGTPANVARILSDYLKQPPKPVLNGEPGYENRAETPTSSAWKCRYEGYWSVFSGAFGFTYGADRVWQFQLEWQDALQYEGAADMQHLRCLIESRPMENRVPDESILISGRGDLRKGPSYCAATRAADGCYAMVYSTMGEPFTLDLSALSGERLHAWWYSPRDGRCYSEQRQQTDHPFEIANVQGPREFAPPTSGLNQDWVLVLDDANRKFPAPGVGLDTKRWDATETVVPGKDWQEATPESQGVDSAQLKAAVENLEMPQLAVIRNGYLIWNGPEAAAYHEIYSCTKVFTSTCLGLMLDDQKCRLDDCMVKYLPEWGQAYPVYRKVTLRHLASMRGGTQGKLGFVGEGQKWGDPVVYVTIPNEPTFAPAGSQIAYQDSDVHLLGRIIAVHLAHEPLKDLFKRRIADPIGMSHWDWGISGMVEGMIHYNAAGTPALKGNGGIRITPLDAARLALLFLNRGNWNGNQLLSAAFIDEATRNQVPVTTPGRSSKDWSGIYGLYWYTNGIRSDGKRRWPSAPAGTYAAQGDGSNRFYVIPEWNMVIVTLGSSDPDAHIGRSIDDFFAKIADGFTSPPQIRKQD